LHANDTVVVGAGKSWLLVQVLAPLLGIGAIAVAAFHLHTSTPQPTLKPLEPTEPVAAPVAPAPPVAVVPELAAPSDTQAPAQTEPSPPPKKKKKAQPKKCRAANGQERPCDSKPSETALAAQSATEQPPSAASLARELEALRQAQRALRGGQAAQALTILEAFEREAAGSGEMQEERAAAATMARCALARAEQDKRGLYGEFVQHYPKSAYAARLRRTCLQQP